jgi:hypothetical protein
LRTKTTEFYVYLRKVSLFVRGHTGLISQKTEVFITTVARLSV